MPLDPDPRPPIDRDAPRRECLDPDRLPGRFVVLEESRSTNADLAARARAGAAAGTVVVAEHQYAGRGRLDRTWHTPPRSALTFSVLFRPDLAPARWPWIPLATGVAVHQALAGRVAGIGLKWPNDVLVTTSEGRPGERADRKLAGILVERVETDTGPVAVIGIGLNTSMTEAERPVGTATSMLLENGVEPDRTQLLVDLVDGLDGVVHRLERGEDLRPAYESACVTIGRDVRVELPSGAPLVGRVTGIDESGRLGVRTASGLEWVGAGDVIHVRPPIV